VKKLSFPPYGAQSKYSLQYFVHHIKRLNYKAFTQNRFMSRSQPGRLRSFAFSVRALHLDAGAGFGDVSDRGLTAKGVVPVPPFFNDSRPGLSAPAILQVIETSYFALDVLARSDVLPGSTRRSSGTENEGMTRRHAGRPPQTLVEMLFPRHRGKSVTYTRKSPFAIVRIQRTPPDPARRLAQIAEALGSDVLGQLSESEVTDALHWIETLEPEKTS
jgi:hypothetical protein